MPVDHIIYDKNQKKIKETVKGLEKQGSDTELPNRLRLEEVKEFIRIILFLTSVTTISRRGGQFYQVKDHFYYFTQTYETIPDILEKIGISPELIPNLSVLMAKLYQQLFRFSIQDSRNYQKLKRLQFKPDTPLLLPLAIPDPFVQEKRRAISSSLRQQVWEHHFSNSRRGSCYVCKKTIKNENNGWHCAHIIPYIICKSHELKNLTVSCPTCNLQCGTLNFNDFKISYSSS